jgi:hypothetical protein
MQEPHEAVAGRHDPQVLAHQINRLFLPYGHIGKVPLRSALRESAVEFAKQPAARAE